MKKKFAIYDCTFTDLPDELPRIAELEREVVKLNGIVTHTFMDANARGLDPRPRYKALLSLVRSSGVDAVIVYSLDRFAVRLKACLKDIALFDDKGVGLVCLYEGINTMLEKDKILFTAARKFEQIAYLDHRRRTLKGMELAKKKGTHFGRPGLNDERLRLFLKYTLEHIRNPDYAYTPKVIQKKVPVSSASFFGLRTFLNRLEKQQGFAEAAADISMGERTLRRLFEMYQDREDREFGKVPELNAD